MHDVPGSAIGGRSVRGPHFTYMLPAGWWVAEEGRYGLALRSPDMAAGINVIGQSGLLQAMPPEAYAYSILTGMMQSPNAQIFNVRPIRPAAGFTHAAVMDTLYVAMMPQGPAWFAGLIVANVAVGYQVFGGVVALAAALQHQWPHYASWLPATALEAVNTGPDPYGSRAMAGVIHGIAAHDGAAASRHRAWSQQVWDEVVRDRQAQTDQVQRGLGPMLTGQDWYADPYGNQPLRRSVNPAARWVSRDGREVSSDNPTYDPRTPTDSGWRRVQH